MRRRLKTGDMVLIAALLLMGVLFSVISFLLSLHWLPHTVIR